MVNAAAKHASSERRERTRAVAAEPASLGVVNLNPFGDLHTLQHLSARLAKALRPVFDPLFRAETRIWAEPLLVQRFADYRTERGDALRAWLALPTGSDAPAQLVFDFGFVLTLLDLFFGGSGALPATAPKELTPAAEAMVTRLGGLIAPVLTTIWEPVARLDFAVGAVEANPATIPGVDGDDALVVTRFGIALGTAAPAFFDLLYPVATLKPHTQGLIGKVHAHSPGRAPARTPAVDPAWRSTLTRAVMGVRLPVRSVLAEPVISLARLLELKVGDVIPIGLGDAIPVVVGDARLGTGTVGTANGQAAIQLTALAAPEGLSQ